MPSTIEFGAAQSSQMHDVSKACVRLALPSLAA